MNTRYLTDPDHPEQSRDIEERLAEAMHLAHSSNTSAAASRSRLLERVRAASAAQRALIIKPLTQGVWGPLVPGIRVKPLAQAQRAFLLDITAGASLPVHRHHEDEECVVLRGEVRMRDIRVRAGDYHLAPMSSRHSPVSSPEGALIYLRGTPIGDTAGTVRDLITGLMPSAENLVTLRAGEGEWIEIANGVAVRPLYERQGAQSCMLRFEPGTALRMAPTSGDRELLVVSGELYFGRNATSLGDYQLAPADSACPEMASDEGAVVFVRGPQLV